MNLLLLQAETRLSAWIFNFTELWSPSYLETRNTIVFDTSSLNLCCKMKFWCRHSSDTLQSITGVYKHLHSTLGCFKFALYMKLVLICTEHLCIIVVYVTLVSTRNQCFNHLSWGFYAGCRLVLIISGHGCLNTNCDRIRTLSGRHPFVIFAIAQLENVMFSHKYSWTLKDQIKVNCKGYSAF